MKCYGGMSGNRTHEITGPQPVECTNVLYHPNKVGVDGFEPPMLTLSRTDLQSVAFNQFSHTPNFRQ